MFKELFTEASISRFDIDEIKDWIEAYYSGTNVEVLKNKGGMRLVLNTDHNNLFIKEFNKAFKNKRNTNFSASIVNNHVEII